MVNTDIDVLNAVKQIFQRSSYGKEESEVCRFIMQERQQYRQKEELTLREVEKWRKQCLGLASDLESIDDLIYAFISDQMPEIRIDKNKLRAANTVDKLTLLFELIITLKNRVIELKAINENIDKPKTHAEIQTEISRLKSQTSFHEKHSKATSPQPEFAEPSVSVVVRKSGTDTVAPATSAVQVATESTISGRYDRRKRQILPMLVARMEPPQFQSSYQRESTITNESAEDDSSTFGDQLFRHSEKMSVAATAARHKQSRLFENRVSRNPGTIIDTAQFSINNILFGERSDSNALAASGGTVPMELDSSEKKLLATTTLLFNNDPVRNSVRLDKLNLDLMKNNCRTEKQINARQVFRKSLKSLSNQSQNGPALDRTTTKLKLSIVSPARKGVMVLQQCERCQKLFKVKDNHDSACRWHSKLPIPTKQGELHYPCCNQPLKSPGCLSKSHVLAKC